MCWDTLDLPRDTLSLILVFVKKRTEKNNYRKEYYTKAFMFTLSEKMFRIKYLRVLVYNIVLKDVKLLEESTQS